ncbi:amidohydrolase family protein [Allokutzneria sp. A3M-2-11 16]|uniref:amidohydrolase family protein n=1 Tax=Allokutzneria sp. A3M-2-11 16 TaxID=2962043 RepID=UPI0020B7D3DD|nr:amidohydrolase family protein [Allokutzneria sp. A3M-2-11 16]MCP3801669.1 amidohydrolase family protein [Allokutzneria sp. A3M-2-11 16]
MTASRRRFLGMLGLALTAGDSAAEERTALVNGVLVDGTGAAPRPATIVLDGDRIVSVGQRQAPRGCRVVDVRGKFVIPGLWDAHVHHMPWDRIFPPLFLANGVTGVRDMWSFPYVHEFRRRIDRGELAGPRILLSSNIIDGPHSLQAEAGATQVRTAAEARAAVRAAVAGGAEFVKIYQYLDETTYAAIADECRGRGVPFAGHLPDRIAARYASDSGQRTIEHLFGLFTATATNEAELRERIARLPVDPANSRGWYNAVRKLEEGAARHHDQGKAAALYADFRRNRTWQVPTLHVLKVLSSPVEALRDDPRLKYVPAAMRTYWEGMVRSIAPAREFFLAQKRLVAEMHAAGVGVLAGTDTNNPYCFPGFGLHDELELLVEVGLSPMAALQSATRDAARAFGRNSGTVEPGKDADLVVLEANPLADIRNTRRVDSVVARGRLITREQRLRMLADAEEAAKTAKMEWGSSGCGCFAT